VQHEVRLAVEGNGMLARQQEKALLADRGDPLVRSVGVDRRRLLALQSEHHRLRRAVTVPRRAQGAEQLRLHAGRVGEPAGVDQAVDETITVVLS
jgi:hypothetical protein